MVVEREAVVLVRDMGCHLTSLYVFNPHSLLALGNCPLSARVVLRSFRGRHMPVSDNCMGRLSQTWRHCINPPVTICVSRRARCEDGRKGDGARKEVEEQMCRRPEPEGSVGGNRSELCLGVRPGRNLCLLWPFWLLRRPCPKYDRRRWVVTSRDDLMDTERLGAGTDGGRAAANRPHRPCRRPRQPSLAASLGWPGPGAALPAGSRIRDGLVGSSARLC